MLSANKGGVQELFKETAPAPGDLIPNTAHDIEYDVSLLDYDYAAKCTDVQELQRLFQILK